MNPSKTAPCERLVPNPKARLQEQLNEVCRFKHRLENGQDIRTVQELPGLKEVSTTQIDSHVMQKPGRGVRRPLDG